MYIYHALINTPSAHMIHINLDMIFHTHVEHSPTETIYIKYYTKQKNALHTHTHTHTPHGRTHARTHARTHTNTHTHTHTHTHTQSDCSRNRVLVLARMDCEKRKVFSLALKDDRVEQCLRSCGSEFQMGGPKQEMARKP